MSDAKNFHPEIGWTFGEVINGSVTEELDSAFGKWQEWTEKRIYKGREYYLRLDTGNNWLKAGLTLESLKPVKATRLLALLREIGLADL